MSMHNRSVALPPAHHTRMLERCIADGFIKRVGDSYEITPKGHEYTMALSRARGTHSTFAGNDEPQYEPPEDEPVFGRGFRWSAL